jgi:hypothetical protein
MRRNVVVVLDGIDMVHWDHLRMMIPDGELGLMVMAMDQIMGGRSR